MHLFIPTPFFSPDLYSNFYSTKYCAKFAAIQSLAIWKKASSMSFFDAGKEVYLFCYSAYLLHANIVVLVLMQKLRNCFQGKKKTFDELSFATKWHNYSLRSYSELNYELFREEKFDEKNLKNVWWKIRTFFENLHCQTKNSKNIQAQRAKKRQ